MVTRREVREAAAVLRRLLDMVDAGEVTAEEPLGAGVVRQVRGALVALDAVATTQRDAREQPPVDPA